MQEDCVNELFNTISKDKIILNEPMSKHTSFKIGGPAEIFIKANCIEDVKHVLAIAKKYNVPIYVIGNGSNLLVHDEGVKGIVLKIEMNNITINRKDNIAEIIAECGATMATIAYNILQQEITGFEELSGIPGTIGGAIRMNAGAHGKEMKDVVVSTTYIDMDGHINTLTNDEQEFTYRDSIFSKNNFIILESKLQLEYGKKEEIQEKMKNYSTWRRENQPVEYPNAGSSFKRGNGFITAKLIDECGLKGYQIGGAQVSTKHAGFIVNTGNATAKDILDLAEYIKNDVYKKTGKKIELEIQVI